MDNSHNHKKLDFGDPKFSGTTIVLPIVIRKIPVVHLKNLRVHIIHTYSYLYLRYWDISTGEIV